MTRFAKLYAALAATVAIVVTVTTDGTVTLQDAVAIGASLFGALGVYTLPNTPPPVDPRHPANDRGDINVDTLLLIAVLVFTILTYLKVN